MNKAEQAKQLRLAAGIIETEHPFEVKLKGWWERITKASPIVAIANGNEIRPVLATPPDGKPLHNPDNLTAEQVGLGYRLTGKGEKPTPGAQVWEGLDDSSGIWQKRDGNAEPYYAGSTYRLPLSVPWPEANPQAPPFQLPPPPPGMKWHREDGWKDGDLPQGYRPLTKGEKALGGFYEAKFTCRADSWEEQVIDWDVPLLDDLILRTTRPLTFTQEGKQWTWHRPGDPMPCDGEREIFILCQDLSDRKSERWASDCRWSEGNNADIIGWRYADTTKQVQFAPEDLIAKLKEVIAMLETATNQKA
jgi:hypothetical protein